VLTRFSNLQPTSAKKVSAKTIVNVVTSVFAILDYAGRRGMKVTKVGFADLELGFSLGACPPSLSVPIYWSAIARTVLKVESRDCWCSR
jgi:hypothetical protein